MATTALTKRRSVPVQNSFEGLVLPAYRGLARRLVDGTLRPVERAAYERTVAALRLRDEGLSLRAIADKLHTTENALKKFVARGVFRTIAQFLRDQESAPHVERLNRSMLQRQVRAEWDEFAPEALDYFRDAFRRGDDGEYLDPDRAERAARLVAKSQGWTEPEPPTARPIRIGAGIIQERMRAIAASDASLSDAKGDASGDKSLALASRKGEFLSVSLR